MWPRTIPLIILRLLYLYRVYHSPDITSSSFNSALVTVIHTNYCIIASCLPFLKPLIDSLSIGLITNEIRVPVTSDDSTNSKDLTSPFAILSGRTVFKTRNVHGWTRFPASDYSATATVGKNDEMEFRDLEQYGSRDRMVINQTKTIAVSSDLRAPRR